ncbi:MAG TPA: YbgC/FadM family acyl-CoA thioesterase [Sphingomonas sp.]
MVTDPLDQPATGRIVDGEHRFAVRVYFEDTDAGGVVYHASYLRFMERARSDMLRLAGIDQRGAMEGGIGGYVVAEIAIRYRRPGKLDDALRIDSRIVGTRVTSGLIQQRVMRGEELVADADVTVVFVGSDGRPKRQPADWIEAFARLQGETGPT